MPPDAATKTDAQRRTQTHTATTRRQKRGRRDGRAALAEPLQRAATSGRSRRKLSVARPQWRSQCLRRLPAICECARFSNRSCTRHRGTGVRWVPARGVAAGDSDAPQRRKWKIKPASPVSSLQEQKPARHPPALPPYPFLAIFCSIPMNFIIFSATSASTSSITPTQP